MFITQQYLGVSSRMDWLPLKKVVCVHLGDKPAQIQLNLALCFCEGLKAEKQGLSREFAWENNNFKSIWRIIS